jgi:hypothetical protein
MQSAKEATMETLLLIIGIAAAAFLFARPGTPPPQVIYVPLAVEEPQNARLGCLPLIVITILALLLLSGGLS